MKLKARSGNAFEAVMLGYEHPNVTEDWWDSNWLIVNGKAATPQSSWRFVEPCVTTFELAGLADWLQTLRRDAPPSDEYGFAEPNLQFSYSRLPAPTLRVRFAYASAPPDCTDDDQRARGVTLEFPIAELNIDEIVGEVRNAVIEYPIRGGAA
jgi:hypothetical protein